MRDEVVWLDNLKRLREEAGLSQQKLADQLGLTQQSIFSYETGAYEPDLSTLKRLADYFNTSIDYLVGNTEIRHRIEKVEKFDLNKHEAQIMEEYRSLSAKAQKSFRLILTSLIDLEKGR